eukprot:5978544-Lingulodinium_polyedra.AAC.1
MAVGRVFQRARAPAAAPVVAPGLAAPQLPGCSADGLGAVQQHGCWARAGPRADHGAQPMQPPGAS